MIIIPAYGKSYKNETEVKEAWENDVDFRVLGGYGSYVSLRGWKRYCSPLDSVMYSWDGIKFYIHLGYVG